LEAELALVIVFAIAAQIPHKQNKAAKQYPRFLFENFAKFSAHISRKQNKATKQH
jgi:ferredoxin